LPPDKDKWPKDWYGFLISRIEFLMVELKLDKLIAENQAENELRLLYQLLLYKKRRF